MSCPECGCPDKQYDGHVCQDYVRAADVAAGGRQCRVCGCTDNSACEAGCGWVAVNLCSECVDEEPAHAV